MEFSHFFKKIARSLNTKKSKKKPSEVDTPSPLSFSVLNRSFQETQFISPPPLTHSAMSCPSPSARPADSVYPKHYANPTKHRPHFQYNNPNFSQTAVDPLSSPEQSPETESDSAFNFLPPPTFHSSPKPSSDYTFLVEERSKPPFSVYATHRNQSLEQFRPPKPQRPLSYSVPPPDKEKTFGFSPIIHKPTASPSKHQPLSTETLVSNKVPTKQSSPLKALPLTKTAHHHAKYMIKLSLSIQELARLVAPPGAFKMPPIRNPAPLPSTPQPVRIQPALEPPQFLSGEVMLWENYTRRASPKANTTPSSRPRVLAQP